MNRKNLGELFGSYIKDKTKLFLLLTAFVIIYLVVFLLAKLPIGYIGYAGLLCTAVGMLALLLDFRAYYKKNQRIYEIYENLDAGLGRLPIPGNLTEGNLIGVLQEQSFRQAQLLSKSDAKVSDMIDYYTLWVHQIKTPISAMSLMLQEEDSRRSRELSLELMKIQQYAEMVLQYLRLDSDSTDYILKTVGMDTMIRTCIRKYAPMFIRKKIAVEYEGTEKEMVTDEKWFQFVIEQLLTNSLKYTLEGSIRIQVSPRELIISDTGIGIAKEDVPRVFEKGFTGFNGRMDKKSTGIGLYLCKRIVEKLGCTIAIDSEAGRGTSVTIGFYEHGINERYL